jgi:UDP-MurNAc hydroxylase
MSAMNNLLTFVNHASFHIANDDTLLLVDPWVEGAVFNNGWRLLDNSTSNSALVRELSARKLPTFIWFSHEQPDHLSMSFIKKLQQEFIGKVTLLYRQTQDRRVAGFLRQQGFEVVECAPGHTLALDAQLGITVFPCADGRSWCLIKSGRRTILNLNNCALATAAACQAVKDSIAALAPRVDVLLTQFGYAHWVGNPFEPGLRRRAAAEQRQRISLQMDTFAPALTIPFASFMAFSSIENNYLNDYQNSAYTIAQWASLSPTTEKLRFMKPRDVIDLDTATPATLVRMSHLAVAHWEKLGGAAHEALPPEASLTAADVETAIARHRAAVAANLPVLPWLLEMLGLIKPLMLFIPDIGLTVRVSYVGRYQAFPIGTAFDISLSSSSAVFLFSNAFGYDTTYMNGRFRTASPGAQSRFRRFFMPQNLARQGYGIGHSLATAGHLAGNVLGHIRAGA